MRIDGPGAPSWRVGVDLTIALLVGFAVVRGIEAALGLPISITPLLDKRILSDVREREKRDAE